MENKTENNKGKWIVVVLLVLIIALLAFLLVHILKPKEKEVSEIPNPKPNEITEVIEIGKERPKESKDLENTKVQLVDQLGFDLDDMDFNFVVCKLHVTSNAPCNIPLSHFKTSEGIVLNEVDDYVKQLEDKNYFLGRQNVWFSLISQNGEFDANIFVPVKDKKAKEITITCDFDDDFKMVIPLKEMKGTASLLKYEADDVITDGHSYEMKVSEALDITGSYLYQEIGDEEIEYMLPSTTKVYAFKVEAVSFFGDSIVIEEANYVPTNSKETFYALEEGINSMKYDNIVGKTIDELGRGWLFFVVYNPDQNPITYNGTLQLKLKNESNPITIHVSLN